MDEEDVAAAVATANPAGVCDTDEQTEASIVANGPTGPLSGDDQKDEPTGTLSEGDVVMTDDRMPLLSRMVCRHRSRCCQACCWISLILFLVLAVVGILVAVYFPDLHPPITMECRSRDFQATAGNASFSTDCTLSITNRNKFAFEIASATMVIGHKGFVAQTVHLGRTVFPAKQTTSVPVNVRIVLNFLEMDKAMSNFLTLVMGRCQATTATFPIEIKGQARITTSFMPVSIAIPVASTKNIECPPTIVRMNRKLNGQDVAEQVSDKHVQRMNAMLALVRAGVAPSEARRIVESITPRPSVTVSRAAVHKAAKAVQSAKNDRARATAVSQFLANMGAIRQ